MFRKRRRRRPTVVTNRVPLTRFIGPLTTVLALVFLLGLGLTKGIDFNRLDRDVTATDVGGGTRSGKVGLGLKKPGDRIRVAGFRVSDFDEKKISDKKLLNTLAQLTQQFDVLAVQDIAQPTARPLDRLIQAINAEGARYAVVVSPSQGRGSYQRQYGFIWDTSRVQLVPQTTYVVNDDHDRMRLPPMVATFQAVLPTETGRDGFSFTMVNVAIDPSSLQQSERENELSVLNDVLLSVREFEYARQGQDDVIVVGDLRVDWQQRAQLNRLRNFISVVGASHPGENGDFQHILVDRSTTSEFTSAAGYYDLVADLGLTEAQALQISDQRRLAWAEFQVFEQPAHLGIASRP